MPYRALLITMVTCGLALLAAALYALSVAPFLTTTSAGAATRNSNVLELTRGTLMLAFVLICLLLIIGVAASLREWFRLRSRTHFKNKTPYVDAWRIAGQRMQTPEKEEE